MPADGLGDERRVNVEDSQMRRGRKSRLVLFDGYKRHMLRDLDTGLVAAAGITLAELHIDRAYLSSALVRDSGPVLAIFCKAWRVRNTGGR